MTQQQIIIMTPELLKEYAFSVIDEYERRRAEQEAEAAEQETYDPNEVVYGIRGIREIFNISHKKACAYKKSFLMEGGATVQRGRKIITNIARAKQLFAEQTISQAI